MFTKKFEREFFAWSGVAAILLGYLLNISGLINVKSPAYLLLNIFGSAAIAYHAYRKKDWQPVVLNIIWLAAATIIAFSLWK